MAPTWEDGAPPWIIGGMAVLGLGGFAAAAATALMATAPLLGILAATAAFIVVGIGVGASGTNLLVLLAKRVAPERRPAAATIVWMMMIFGFILTAATAGAALEPFSFSRLLMVSGSVALLALLVTALALWGIEGEGVGSAPEEAAQKVPFREALASVWGSLRRAASPSLSLSLCWPIAPRTSSSSPLQGRFLA